MPPSHFAKATFSRARPHWHKDHTGLDVCRYSKASSVQAGRWMSHNTRLCAWFSRMESDSSSIWRYTCVNVEPKRVYSCATCRWEQRYTAESPGFSITLGMQFSEMDPCDWQKLLVTKHWTYETNIPPHWPAPKPTLLFILRGQMRDGQFLKWEVFCWLNK